MPREGAGRGSAPELGLSWWREPALYTLLSLVPTTSVSQSSQAEANTLSYPRRRCVGSGCSCSSGGCAHRYAA
jgi:hypothetical protein